MPGSDPGRRAGPWPLSAFRWPAAWDGHASLTLCREIRRTLWKVPAAVPAWRHATHVPVLLVSSLSYPFVRGEVTWARGPNPRTSPAACPRRA